MLQKKGLSILFALIVIVTATACSEFSKLQKSDDWKVKYDAAVKYYKDKDYYRAGVLFEQILPIVKGTQYAEDAEFYYAYTNFYQEQYLLSSYYFDSFYQTFGRSERAEEAYYMYAYSLFKQSPIYQLDQTSTYEAITALQNFINRYPGSERTDEATKLIDDLQVKLEKKAYENARLYYDLGRYKAAVIAFENFRKDYPDSDYNEELAYLKVKTQYELAANSIITKQKDRFEETIDYYESFIDRYPNSRFTRDAEKLYDKSILQLNKLSVNKNS
jgi:outer membrane protein assembly factor BamD